MRLIEGELDSGPDTDATASPRAQSTGGRLLVSSLVDASRLRLLCRSLCRRRRRHNT